VRRMPRRMAGRETERANRETDDGDYGFHDTR
jgi:hypothetical protein